MSDIDLEDLKAAARAVVETNAAYGSGETWIRQLRHMQTLLSATTVLALIARLEAAEARAANLSNAQSVVWKQGFRTACAARYQLATERELDAMCPYLRGTQPTESR